MEGPQSIEAIGVTVDEAIGRGLDALNATREQVTVDVIEPGGGKAMARVRVTLQPGAAPTQPSAAPPLPEPVVEHDADVAREVLLQLLKGMHVQATVEARRADAEDEHDLDEQGKPPLIVNIKGDDLGLLIGRRGETLRDLQYLARAIVAKRADHHVNLVVDVEGYRQRRERQLRQLAARLAERAASTRKTVALEPMPANERRIIHLALRDHPDVTTQSVGAGEYRKVTIIPKPR